MTPSNGAMLPVSDPFDEVRNAFVQWLRSGGTDDVVRVRIIGRAERYSVEWILHVVSYSDELLTPDEWRLVREWLHRHDAWDWSAAKGGRTIPPLTLRLATRMIRESRTR